MKSIQTEIAHKHNFCRLLSQLIVVLTTVLSCSSADIATLRKKFEEDKLKIQQMKAQRKFRPYWPPATDHRYQDTWDSNRLASVLTHLCGILQNNSVPWKAYHTAILCYCGRSLSLLCVVGRHPEADTWLGAPRESRSNINLSLIIQVARTISVWIFVVNRRVQSH